MYKSYLLVIALAVISCGTKKDIVYQAPLDYEETILDTLMVSAPTYIEEETIYELSPYNPEATRSYDLIHTKLDLSFDWAQQHVLGKAYLTIAPLFYPIDRVVLDAKQFDIHAVHLGNGANGKKLAYTYDDLQMVVTLDRMYTRTEKLQIYIDYTARPEDGPIGGSAAITSDKGLFFINPTNEIEDKPRQIWTQGETENNSKWFPTFDKPNERCTQEMYLTVQDSLQTLSNGTLISSTKNSNGTRTDYWKMDQPHAPYLFMIMIGDFATVTDTWNGKPLAYMVDPPFASSAKQIFNHTPEMLTFFSDLLDYPYPWDKYSQVIAEDYVSGAMENTTGVIFGDFVQKTARELIDNENDQIVAHEMFHHWFGDLVTCESWANLTLNEGFANYSEYLWYEHKYGKDAADAIRMSEMEGYMYMAQQSGTHPLIHYGYNDKEEMFDAHSYNKGGLVLHMLRNIVGDEAFFAALSKYLKDNEYTAVETAELRIAFEDVTGSDLNWFFDQWYLDQGHPVLEVSYTYSDDEVMIYVEQTQSEDEHRPIFILPFETAVYDQQGKATYYSTVIDARRDTIIINGIATKPLATVLDGKSTMLGTINEVRDSSEWKAILQYSSSHYDKRIACNNLASTPALTTLAGAMMNDNHQTIRSIGLQSADMDQLSTIKKMITNDPHSAVRVKALNKYADLVGDQAISVAKTVVDSDVAYGPVTAAIDVLNRYDTEAALSYGEKLIKDPSPTVTAYLTTLFASSGRSKYLPFIEENLSKISIYQLFNAYGKYADLLLQQNDNTIISRIDRLKDDGINNSNIYYRFLATNLLNSAKSMYSDRLEQSTETDNSTIEGYIDRLDSALKDVISKEKDENLISRYSSF